MRAVLGHSEIPDQFLADPLRAEAALTMLMVRASDEQADVSKILDGQLKPGIGMTIVAPVDTDVFTPAGPPVQVFEARVGLIGGDGVDPAQVIRRVAGEVSDPAAIGVTVVSPRGIATVNLAGRFVVPARAGDELVIETAPPLTVVVPPEGGVRVG